MARAESEMRSLRPNRLELGRITVALLLSLFIHLAGWGGYLIGKKLGVWQHLHTSAWLQKLAHTPIPPAAQQKKKDEQQLIFVEVTHPETEAPKDTKYYSNQNSQAANPDANQAANQPKLDGKQKEVPKTEDATVKSNLHPSPPPAPDQTETAKSGELPHPNDPLSLGNLKLTKPQPEQPDPQKPAEPAQPQRPRTIKQALAQQQMPGQKMQQDGGVRRQRVWSSLDTKATAFGDYDRAIIDAVQNHWYQLLDSHRFAQDRTGRVVLHFRLKSDGSVEELKIQENTVGDLLGYVCEEAIAEAAPFGKWPTDMQREIGTNYRDISFTFYYY